MQKVILLNKFFLTWYVAASLFVDSVCILTTSGLNSSVEHTFYYKRHDLSQSIVTISTKLESVVIAALFELAPALF
jgi:hypothetical protein